MRLLTPLLLLPLVAHADEVVTRKDGSQVLLKDDYTWQPLSGTVQQPEPGVVIVTPPQAGCLQSGSYRILDERFRNLKSPLSKMAETGEDICLNGYMQVGWESEKVARILYTRPTQAQQEDSRVYDQMVSLKALPGERRLAIARACADEFCRATIYGRMMDETTIQATSIEVHGTEPAVEEAPP